MISTHENVGKTVLYLTGRNLGVGLGMNATFFTLNMCQQVEQCNMFFNYCFFYSNKTSKQRVFDAFYIKTYVHAITHI